MNILGTLLTISAADVKISVAAILFTAVEILVAVAAPSCAGCICDCGPRVNPLAFCSTLALHHMDLFRTLHVQTLSPFALLSLLCRCSPRCLPVSPFLQFYKTPPGHHQFSGYVTATEIFLYRNSNISFSEN